MAHGAPAKADRSCKSQALKVTWSIAQVIQDVQDKVVQNKLKRPLAESAASGPRVVDDFQINNNMFVESRLWFRESANDSAAY